MFFLEGLSYVAVVIGVAYAASQYYLSERQARKDDAVAIEKAEEQARKVRVEASLDFIRGYQQDHIVTARLQLLNNWNKFPIPLSEIDGLPGSAEVIDQYANSFIFQEDGTVEADQLITVIDYLDVVGTCVKEDICLSSIIATHLGRDARSFYCLYGAPIERLRKDRVLKNFAVEIKELLPEGEDCYAQ
ncbi:MAG: hypothetical protein AAGE89_03995 [Pseudomonadota bacterium]